MRELHVSKIIETVKKLCIDANYYLGQDIRDRFKEAKEREDFPMAENILDILIENADIAQNEQRPMCQDTGMAVVFIEIGQEVHVIGGSLEEAINEGVRQGYTEGYLRKSVVGDPIERINTKDNTPAVIHYEIIPGDGFKVTVAPKGFGSENMSQLKMLKPADGVEGIKEFVLQVVKEAGPNPCPPIVVGIGIGGTFDKAAFLAKKALLRSTSERNPKSLYERLEEELLVAINDLGIGPQGFGGRTTALAVNIETYGTHIAGLPVAVNINCHATRHSEAHI
ncbi:hydro-lyase, Fe-S type, tartrate/fumarate subfamily, alpha subunit [Alkaliphilus metalliredigens QYMF]|uniref:Hydro-lyase, Fe-S type, tartrate/fumarate subfamily, alpha subunit n=1 Tax=Alkaliphilus metalliredigens (strain QYMF) TaxID=293826 RepID=A6TTM3_ALKMQ|nr:fumarate hydratase [Alkaliphilus metalliredigens]ABR49541.1 hydro-lyase, Fe-S type, tartrate/fumarate subfamily, alpha subunit [Alkaliphilus metalliredigens QYMF]